MEPDEPDKQNKPKKSRISLKNRAKRIEKMSPRPRRLMPPSLPVAGEPPIHRIELDQFARRLHQHMSRAGHINSDLARLIWGEVEQTDAQGRTYLVAKNRDRIGTYLKGRGYPEPATLQKIANIYGVTKEDLAPELTASAIDRERPEFGMTMVQGHVDKVHVQINALLPLWAATKIAALVEKAKSGKIAKHLIPGVDIDVE